MLWLFVTRGRRSAPPSARAIGARGGVGVQARAARDPGPLPGRLDRDRGARVRRRRRAARLRLPRRLPRGPRARQRDDPARGTRSRRSTRGWRGSRSWGCSSCSACSCSRASLPDVALEGTVLALVLVLIARPLAAFVATFGPFSVADRAVLGWAGLRGAVPVVLATFPVIAGVPHSREFFDIVFFAVLLSTVVQGATIEPVARWLGATTTSRVARVERAHGDRHDPPARRRRDRGRGRARTTRSSATASATSGLPRAAIVNVIVRDGQAIPPRGSTRIEAGDRLHVLIRREEMGAMDALLERWREGPVGPPPRPARIPEGHAPVFHVRALERRRRRPGAPRAGRRPRRRRPPAHAPRRARRARAARRRLHRRHRPGARARPRAAARASGSAARRAPPPATPSARGGRRSSARWRCSVRIRTSCNAPPRARTPGAQYCGG